MSGTCAIVVTYNRLELLKQCLDAINRQTLSVNHVIVIDNNSDDGTSDFLNNIVDKKYIIKHLEKNIGGAGGFSAGLEVAMTYTQDSAFWIMDDDTMVDAFAHEKFYQHKISLNDDFSFLISNVRWVDGSPTNVMTTSSNWPDKADKGLVEVLYGTFVSFFVLRTGVQQSGLPISEFFIWGDDAEYSLRLREHGTAYMMSDVFVTHKSNSPSVAPDVSADSADRINRYVYYYRNQLYIYRKYFPNEYRRVLISYFLKVFVVFFKAKDSRLLRCKSILQGIFKSFRFNPKVKNTR